MGYILIGVLPKIGIAVLGIGAADPSALSHFNAQLEFPRTYIDALIHLVSWNLGKTLDQVNVTTVLQEALSQSAPILLISTGLLAVSTMIALLWPQIFSKPFLLRLFEFSTFIPAFLPSFLVLAAAVIAGSTIAFEDSDFRTIILGICIGITPSCLSVITIRSGYELERAQRYVQVMRAYGYDEKGLTAGVRKAVLLHWVPTWEKLLTLQLAVLIFTEAVFSTSGFGSIVLLAVQRTDINVILASIVAISIAVAAVRLITSLALYLLETREPDVRAR